MCTPLHRISRYKSGEGEAPKIYKLGSGAWQKLKTATKKAVKDISRELIALYAKRKASKDLPFAGYLFAAGAGSFVHVGGYARSADRDAGRQAGHGVRSADGPFDLRRCGLRQDRSGDPSGVQGRDRRQQVAVLVPTTILALQHYRSFVHRLRDFPVKVEYLNRTKSSKETSRIPSELAEGRIDILIGTHKILGKQVKFHDLGLLIIDEEQKFGVAAKEKLTQMSVNVDTLTSPRRRFPARCNSRSWVRATCPSSRRRRPTGSRSLPSRISSRRRSSATPSMPSWRGGQVYFVHNRVEDLMTLQGIITRLCPRRGWNRATARCRPNSWKS